MDDAITLHDIHLFEHCTSIFAAHIASVVGRLLCADYYGLMVHSGKIVYLIGSFVTMNMEREWS